MTINSNASLFTFPRFQAFTTSGNPLAGGQLYSYAAGTLTPQATYTDSSLTIPNPNPVILDAFGTAAVWLGNSNYKFNLLDINNVQQANFPIDNVQPINNALTAKLASPTGASSVGSESSYTGAVPRTVQSKLYDWVSVLDFGADPTGNIDSSSAFVNASLTLKRIYVPSGTYICNAVFTVNVVMFGDGPLQTIIKPNLLTSAAFTFFNITSNQTVWTISNIITDMTFKDPGTQTGIGIACVAITPSSSYVAGDESVSIGTLRNVNFTNLKKGIVLPYGNIGAWFHDCSWLGCYYGIYNLDNKYSSSVQMPVSCKYFYGGNFSNNICAVYLDNATSGAGAYEFYGTVIENNFIAIRFNNLGVMSHPILFNGVWFEQNGKNSYTGTNSIDVWTGTTVVATATSPNQFIFSGQNLNINFKDTSTVGDINMSATNSLITIEGCGVDGAAITVTDSGSQVRIKNSNHLGPIISGIGVTWDDPPYDIWQNILGQTNPPATQFSWIAPKRSLTNGSDGTKIISLDMAWMTHTTAGIVGTATLISDGVVFNSCNQITVPFTASGQLSRMPDTSITTGTTTGNTYMVVMFDVKINSGPLPTFYIQNENSGVILLELTVPTTGVWYTVATLVTIPPTGIPNTGSGLQYLDVLSSASGTVVYSISAFQAVQFITKESALNFLKLKSYTIVPATLISISSSSTIYPPSPVFYVSGTTTIANIAVPYLGYQGSITIIPTGLFVTTVSGGNIGLASVAVVNKALIMTFDPGSSKWYPSY